MNKARLTEYVADFLATACVYMAGRMAALHPEDFSAPLVFFVLASIPGALRRAAIGAQAVEAHKAQSAEKANEEDEGPRAG